MKVVLLAGGKGTRIAEESTIRPKPMIEIGGMPILWHIMKEYSYYGFNDFIICAGYRQHMIKEWFADYYLYTSDITFDFTESNEMIVHDKKTEPWKVTIVDTGLNTMTGGRDVDIKSLLDFHRSHGKAATLTSVILEEEKGHLDIAYDNSVKAFREKKIDDSKPINAGYMVFEPKIFDYLEDDSTVLEREPLERLAVEGQLMSYRHHGFWQCMDTLLQKQKLEKMWEYGKAPWKSWN